MARYSKLNQIILILIDDVRASHIFELINQKKLPNLATLSQSGITCQNCITTYPSVTFPCYSNIITGTYSGYFPIEGSGIPLYHYVRRLDPPATKKRFPKIINYGAGTLAKLNRELGENCRTIFEQADKGNLFSSMNIVSRGSLLISPKPYTTEMALRNVEKVYRNPNFFFENGEVPFITVVYIPYTDHLMHHKGFQHPDYINEIKILDQGLGKVIDALKSTGYYESTAIGIISDHGNYKGENVYDLEPFFQQLGLLQYQPRKGTGDFDCNFGALGFLNFRGDNWHFHPTIEQMENFKPSGIGKKSINLFEKLWKIPGVKYMYYKDDENKPDKGIIHIKYKDKTSNRVYEGMIEYENHGLNQKTRYIFEDIEFFGYDNDSEASKMLDQKSYNINEWLHHTNHIDFPMIIDQLPRCFKNPKTCDILISNEGSHVFNYEHGKTMDNSPYSHDTALRNSMVVPFIIGGSPEVPKLELKYCKTTDMVPTLLDFLGIKPHPSVVGKSVLNY
ncbi:MAG: alkaline phosphatase family protein [Candidatus Hodarchaeota archaeon]